VREARAEEHARIAELTIEAFGELASLMEPPAFAALEQALTASLADTQGATRLVAEWERAIVGSAAYYDAGADAYGNSQAGGNWPEVRLVAVDPMARRRGVARQLMLECVRRARRSGATMLGLHTSRSMRAAIQLYQHMGFVRDPAHDFQPPGAELIEGYVLNLSHAASTPES
jgi:GNAT superfamily N-acetyltransferase